MPFNMTIPLDTGVLVRIEQNAKQGTSNFFADSKGLAYWDGTDKLNGWKILNCSNENQKILVIDEKTIPCQLNRGFFGLAFLYNPDTEGQYVVGVKASRMVSGGKKNIPNLCVFLQGLEAEKALDNTPNFTDCEEGFFKIKIDDKLEYGGDEFPYVSGYLTPRHSAYSSKFHGSVNDFVREYAHTKANSTSIELADVFSNENSEYMTLYRCFAIPKSERTGIVEIETHVWLSKADSDRSLESIVKNSEPQIITLRAEFD